MLQVGKSVHLATLAKSPAPCKDCGHWVRGCLLALQVLVVVARNGTVCSLVFILSVGTYEHGCHHSKRAEGCADHVAHDIAVVVLACPDVAALGTDNACYGIVDERVEVCKAELLELLLVFFKHFLKDNAELSVVFLGDGVLCREPEVLLRVDSELKATVGKGADGLVRIVHALKDASALELVNYDFFLLSVGTFIYKFCNTLGRHAYFYALIYVAIGVTGYRNGLFPVFHDGMYGGNRDWCAEHGTIQARADCAVRRLPHLVEVVLRHAGFVGGYRCALNGHAKTLCSICRIYGNLVARLIALHEAQVEIFRLQVHEGQDEFVFNHLPKDARHFVAVHLHEGSCHFDFFHSIVV